ncbi:MAG: winged helix-turn-helix transcriptional regulator [Candidatus Kerfeldbacteria bacterium]|nr:winged helix-turn-helix transcriptional regulator [Candidatus Kerfeldbacteria bacterium]
MIQPALERQLKALANRRRLAILAYLRTHRSAYVSELRKHLNLSFKATSKHLQLLFAAELVEREQRSLQMFYSLSSYFPPYLTALIKYL